MVGQRRQTRVSGNEMIDRQKTGEGGNEAIDSKQTECGAKERPQDETCLEKRERTGSMEWGERRRRGEWRVALPAILYYQPPQSVGEMLDGGAFAAASVSISVPSSF